MTSLKCASCTSEPVSNAITHGQDQGGTFTLEVRSFGCCFGVDVADHSPVTPVVRSVAVDMERGRGFLLVAEVADSWGYYFEGGRKHVWFHLRISDSTRAVRSRPRGGSGRSAQGRRGRSTEPRKSLKDHGGTSASLYESQSCAIRIGAVTPVSTRKPGGPPQCANTTTALDRNPPEQVEGINHGYQSVPVRPGQPPDHRRRPHGADRPAHHQAANRRAAVAGGLRAVRLRRGR